MRNACDELYSHKTGDAKWLHQWKGELKIAKYETSDGKHTFSCTFFHGEFEKRMLSALHASFPRGHKVRLFLELSLITYW